MAHATVEPCSILRQEHVGYIYKCGMSPYQRIDEGLFICAVCAIASQNGSVS